MTTRLSAAIDLRVWAEANRTEIYKKKVGEGRFISILHVHGNDDELGVGGNDGWCGDDGREEENWVTYFHGDSGHWSA